MPNLAAGASASITLKAGYTLEISPGCIVSLSIGQGADSGPQAYGPGGTSLGPFRVDRTLSASCLRGTMSYHRQLARGDADPILVPAADIASPSVMMLANTFDVWQDDASFDRYQSNGTAMEAVGGGVTQADLTANLPSALQALGAYNRQAGRLEIDEALHFHQEGPTQGSKLISSTPKQFQGFVLQATSAITRVTFWDQATATASGTKLQEITSGLTAGADFVLDEPLSPLNGIYMEVAGGTGTMNILRES